jgi:hypothetical protein
MTSIPTKAGCELVDTSGTMTRIRVFQAFTDNDIRLEGTKAPKSHSGNTAPTFLSALLITGGKKNMLRKTRSSSSSTFAFPL